MSNSDTTLIVTPTTGAVVASLNLAYYWYSLPSLANSGLGTPSTTAGNFTVGQEFAFYKPCTVTGVRFYWAGGAKTVRCKLWDVPTSSALASIDVSVNAAGVYTGTFASPYSVTGALCGNPFDVTTWITDTSGYNRLVIAASSANFIMPNAATANGGNGGGGFLVGPHIWCASQSSVNGGTGDSAPNARARGAQTEVYPVEPIFTVP